ncbi:MAG: hypothetical protein UX08_C0010G0011 [Candidatus Collierbacteria bacterium GW2011_GWB1_45_35]|uniref:Uracil-DNA glycosylase-like domain-containing protein n=2 Tax=Candidatus Collieribacteriota TaxID=1752725 RepID=A0A0G1KSW6_9BACT|nr:MAG: hypothetical protein UW48_C0007G0010 [Microgenomates group bacterium GW2011_GWC1_44_23]KKT86653.1 MAG: hypothetical protein UW84_C0005G0002 [Candidatus Collierbacteria bacterium GW2011_GWA2_44_99]KKT95391.1 MAG: hypothetical protein UW96_C0007G0020 [Candidatus Collierbacteria bacterium GW2011_GWA1_45_15]KKU00041.1 MAG: hypothetical protein UX01_C0007G0020 [Candidatus Collierbacteria bacterium GW2011_GWB2_45_17]KKU05140.1 MAG: hypothetical protein UX08_C0010G0011 [Candidatus Collierbacte
MIETHPFGDFVPTNTQYLLLGSFTGQITDVSYDWFYGTKRNLFWPIIQEVYGVSLQSKLEKQELFSELGIAITDIILSCERKSKSNLDMNLTNIVLNDEVRSIIKNNQIRKIFFSSRFVEKLFKKYFRELVLEYPQIDLVTLPSPSPRYAAMKKTEKIALYKEVLPKL